MNRRTIFYVYFTIVIINVILALNLPQRSTTSSQKSPGFPSDQISLENQKIKGSEADNVKTISWDLLYKYDYKTKEVPPAIMALDKKTVRLPGFAVPLSDNYSSLSEFLLVPDPQSCIHVPPPPPNLIVFVSLEEPIPSGEMPYPAWISGVFHVETSESPYGNAAYKMLGKKVEKYH